MDGQLKGPFNKDRVVGSYDLDNQWEIIVSSIRFGGIVRVCNIHEQIGSGSRRSKTAGNNRILHHRKNIDRRTTMHQSHGHWQGIGWTSLFHKPERGTKSAESKSQIFISSRRYKIQSG